MNVTPNILFLVYFFRQHVPQCPVDREPLDREKVTQFYKFFAVISSLAQIFPSVSTVVIPSITTFQTISNI